MLRFALSAAPFDVAALRAGLPSLWSRTQPSKEA